MVGLGAARGGTHQFWALRWTSVLLIPLTLAFVLVMLSLVRREHAAAVELLGAPFVAALMFLFVGVGVYHMWHGMQEVILDYVHADLLKFAAVMANLIFCLSAFAVCAVALVRISLSAAFV